MQSQLKVLAPVIRRDVTLPNSSKKVPMVMVPVPDSKTLMAIPLSTINNMTGIKDEQQAKDILNWNDDGIGTLDGCDLRFRINQLGCLELLDSDDDEDTKQHTSKTQSNKVQKKRQNQANNNNSNNNSNSSSTNHDKKIKQISPGCSLLRDGPDNRRARAQSNLPLSAKRPATSSVLLEKLISKKQIEQLKSEVETWSVEDVKSFVDSLHGCGGLGQLFESQQICGKSLLYLDQKDLVDIVNIKLGPAIKIYNIISMIKS